MSVITTPTGSWLAGIAQLLDERHLVMLSDRPEGTASFVRALSSYLRGFPDTQVITVAGRRATDLQGFARALHGPLRIPTGRDVDLAAVAKALRGGAGRVRRRFLIWADADEMLEADVALFSRLVHALLAVAAEHEYVTTEPLVLQRVVFTGGAKLGAYAEEESGQFCAWLDSGGCREATARVERPPVLTYRLNG